MNAFKRWYSKNKKVVSAKKKLKYRNDAAYREAALNRSRSRRKDQKSVSDNKSLSFGEVADTLGVSTVTLRAWRCKDYFPEPVRHGRRLVFSQDQLLLLISLKEMFESYGWSLKSIEAKNALQNKVSLIYANWSE